MRAWFSSHRNCHISVPYRRPQSACDKNENETREGGDKNGFHFIQKLIRMNDLFLFNNSFESPSQLSSEITFYHLPFSMSSYF